MPNQRPVRPKPQITSSVIIRMPWRSQILRRMGKYSGGGLIPPLAAVIGSTMIAAICPGPSRSITSSTLFAHCTPQPG